ncbi:hypothetical protein HYW35_01285 [Candidatus Saccharibacteria bacterium]|nr:hypothetical protein [Candidatus Saccharibacteria bacterium]
MSRNPELGDTSEYDSEKNFHRTRKFGRATIAAGAGLVVASMVTEQINSEALSWVAGVGIGGMVFVLTYNFLKNERPQA